tara:strand:- start:356 stop:514 length:159 start_codon:yes stop_codon:yes gene_type:complete
MRENKTTTVMIEVELQGKKTTLSQEVANHDLEDAVIALLNSALLVESNINEE